MWAAVIAGVIAAGGAIIGQILSNKSKEEVLEILRKSRDQYGNISVPKLQQLSLETLPPSELEKLQEDPEFKRQMQAADSALEDVTRSGGLTISDRAALNQILNRVSQQEAAGRNAIEQKMAAQGALNSGARLTMQLSNQQNAANQAADIGATTAGQAQKRAYQAILDRASLAGQNTDRDWARQREKAAARDAINRSNIEIQNLTRKYNASIPQQQFANELSLANAKAGASAPLANYLGQDADATASTWAQTGNAAGNIVAGGIKSNERKTYQEWLEEAKARGDV